MYWKSKCYFSLAAIKRLIPPQQVFRRRQQDIDKLPPEQIEKGRRELAELERKFLERVAQNTRKTAAMNTPNPATASEYIFPFFTA